MQPITPDIQYKLLADHFHGLSVGGLDDIHAFLVAVGHLYTVEVVNSHGSILAGDILHALNTGLVSITYVVEGEVIEEGQEAGAVGGVAHGLLPA